MFIDDEKIKQDLDAQATWLTSLIAIGSATLGFIVVFGLLSVAQAAQPVDKRMPAISAEHQSPHVQAADVATLSIAAPSTHATMIHRLPPTVTMAPSTRHLLMAAIAAAFAGMLWGGRAIWRNHISKPLMAELERRGRD